VIEVRYCFEECAGRTIPQGMELGRVVLSPQTRTTDMSRLSNHRILRANEKPHQTMLSLMNSVRTLNGPV
jgi:hypothetical protein